MADYTDLDPTLLRASVSDGTNLKPSLTTSSYAGGTPAAAADLKPSIAYADGTLKESIADADGVKANWLLVGSARPPVVASTGVILQQLNTELTSEIAVTGSFPTDGSIPQSSEGTLVASQSITPTNASNLIRVEAHIMGQASASSTPNLFVFSDQQTDAYAGQFCETETAASDRFCGGFVIAEFVAGTTSAISVSLRSGVSAGTWTINKNSTTSWGGVGTSLLSVEEIQV